MSSIVENTDASSNEAELGRIRDDERPPLSEVVVASADLATRLMPARSSIMAAADALLEYASGGRTDNDRESAQWGSAGQTEAIELGAAVGYITHNLWGTTRYHIVPYIILIDVNDLPMCSTFLKLILFADDTIIFFSDKSIDYCLEILNNKSTNLSDWFKANKLSLNLKRKQDILFLGEEKVKS